jgi:hypothetical protein
MNEISEDVVTSSGDAETTSFFFFHLLSTLNGTVELS